MLTDINKAVSIDVKFPGDLVYLLGETFEELGASEYFKMTGEQKGKIYCRNANIYCYTLRCPAGNDYRPGRKSRLAVCSHCLRDANRSLGCPGDDT